MSWLRQHWFWVVFTAAMISGALSVALGYTGRETLGLFFLYLEIVFIVMIMAIDLLSWWLQRRKQEQRRQVLIREIWDLPYCRMEVGRSW